MIQSCIVNNDHPEEFGMFNHFQGDSPPQLRHHHLGDSTWFNLARSAEFVQDSRQRLKNGNSLMCGLCGEQGNLLKTRMQTSHQLSAILPSELSWFKQAKGTSSMLWCVASAWSPRKTLEQISKDQTLGKTNIFQVDLVLTCCFMWNVYSLQLSPSRMLQLFNFPNQKHIHSMPPLRPWDQWKHRGAAYHAKQMATRTRKRL